MDDSRTRWTLGSYVTPWALARGTRAALEALGYQVVPVVTVARFDDPDWRVDLRLIDARHLELPGHKRIELDFGHPINEIIA